ncbi:hypothetical protein Tco_0929445 [Tanacetum coccineum]
MYYRGATAAIIVYDITSLIIRRDSKLSNIDRLLKLRLVIFFVLFKDMVMALKYVADGGIIGAVLTANFTSGHRGADEARMLQRHFNRTSVKTGLRGFEFAKFITLVTVPFTMENGLLTSTFKVKRPQAKVYFAKAIADMYKEIAASEFSGQRVL